MKKILAILISVAMLFTLTATPVLAAFDGNTSARSVNTLEEATTNVDSGLGQYEEDVNIFIKLFNELYEAVHNLLHFFANLFGANCPICGGNGETQEPVESELEKLRKAIVQGGEVGVSKDIIVDTAIDSNEGDGYTSMFNATKDVDIDLKGHKISQAQGVNCDYGIFASNGATVNIYDSSNNNSGSLNAYHELGAWTVFAANGATVNIYGGTFTTNNGTLIYKHTADSAINIYGGRFESTNSGECSKLLNCKDSTGVITVYGGSFKGFRPGVDNASEVVLAEGLAYKQEEIDGEKWYTVIEDPYKDYNKVDSAETLNQAVKQDGKVVATSNIVLEGENSGYSALPFITKTVLFDANGKTITNNTSAKQVYDVLFFVSKGGDLTITGNGNYSHGEQTKTVNTVPMIYAHSNAKVTIENGTFDARGNNTGIGVFATDNSQVVINGGTFINNSDSDLIYVNGSASVIINGGLFKVADSGNPVHILNIRNGAKGTITLYGGTFVNYDPTHPEDSAIKIAEGYKAVSETKDNGEVWYTVVAENK